MAVGILDHGKEQMLYGYVLISELLRLFLRVDQHLVQAVADVGLRTCTGDSRKNLHGIFAACGKGLGVNFHLLNKLCNQAVIHGKKAVQEMLLLHLRVSIFRCHPLAVLNGFQ